jgi:predicted N-acyltransferase
MSEISIEIVTSLDAISQSDWDRCADWATGPRHENPFTTYDFLRTLEDSGSVGAGTGWDPYYLIARADGVVIGVAPQYLKSHSQGEYIFDHSWAHAYERAGGQYYPKLQIAAPFTPVTGRRFLAHPDHVDLAQAALTQGAIKFAQNNGLSSVHITFCNKDEFDRGEQLGLLQRETQQFHWMNNGYADFDAFLGALSARKRKNIKRERATAQGFGGTIEVLTGAEIQPFHWDAFWEFYQDTGARKWGSPYLTRAFFDMIHDRMADDILLVLAKRNGAYVAGALNFIGDQALYGRYWGCVEHHSCLHFELCYYQAIDFAISHGLARVEAGAQGEHKLARGYVPTKTYSLHWFREPRFQDAVAEYLVAERSANSEDIEILTGYGPFKSQPASEDE